MPTAAEFSLIDPSLIIINARQREKLDTEGEHPEAQERSLASLASSIAAYGLINPILIDRNFNLIAGERRLTACKSLGLAEVPVQFADLLTAEESHLIELEENVRRKDIEWPEKAKAIRDYHERALKQNPAWTQALTAEALNVSNSHISKSLLVAGALDANPQLARSSGIRAAYRRVAQGLERDLEISLSRADSVGTPTPDEPATPDPVPIPFSIDCADAHTWVPQYAGQPFDFIHCDFPYGINIDGSKKLREGSGITGMYEDDASHYFSLIDLLLRSKNIRADYCHVMFWFSMEYYTETLQLFRNAGASVQVHPLIWAKTGSQGLVPDPSRTPRRTYETALLISFGDRKIFKPMDNSYAGPIATEHHMSTKPEPMLKHFFSMFVDKGTRVLDLTCGSGTSIRAAHAMGAAAGQGLEINPDFAEHASAMLKNAMLKQQAYERMKG